ncbi:HIT family protein [Hellea balneolensis]|uniref:HIT family protein n=1 Tax=Hellea balneolensis TaxID=287478 RepID=UPI00041562FE|nr:HIT family protein [Hellea balneolensis]
MTLHAPYDSDNIFAKILRGEMPCVKVFEDDNILSFMDVFPQSEGHTLVIPKAPSRNLLETNAKDIGRLFGSVQRIAKAVETALKPDGIIITQFNGAPAGQTVFHTHVHIIPRYESKALGAHGGTGEMADMGMLQELATKISAEL